MADKEQVKLSIDHIEGVMKAQGMWRDQPLPSEAFTFHRAFAADTMTYSQWLQFVFIPRVRSIIAGDGDFPPKSMVGTQAIREFDGDERAADLVTMLCNFDALIEGR